MLPLIKQSFKELLTNRYLTVLVSVTLLLTVVFVGYVIVLLLNRPSEVQLVTHYSAYGVTHFYRDQWFYLLGFGGFAVLAATLHIILAIKVYLIKGHPLAIMFAWLGIAIIVFAWVTFYYLGYFNFNAWSPA